jgi:uncharacterized protein YggE
MTRLLIAVPALLAVVALAGTVGTPDLASADQPAAADTLVVTGEGSVQAAPDDASFSFAVETRASTAKAALAENGAQVRKLIAALRDAGARDLATQYVSVWPVSENGPISGYSASNSVSATIGVDHAGDLVDAAAAAGANNVSGPEMSQRAADGVYRKALAAAVTDAKARAEALAKATGRTLAGISQITEGGPPAMPYYERAAVTADSATPIVPGKQETTATVSVTFELR